MKTIDKIFENCIDGRTIQQLEQRDILRMMRLSRKDLYPLVFPGQKYLIWDCLLVTTSLTTGQISKQINVPSKNVSSQLSAMSKTGLVRFERNGKLKNWYRID